ncbi:MAG: hypothetical protein SVR94_00575 [Pseudomonadota bacterium]|nr:hypothetical protein [Pseudomonadota bacterium]
MYPHKKIIQATIILMLMTLVACSTQGPTVEFYANLDKGIQALVHDLFKAIKKEVGLWGSLSETSVVLEPFVDKASGQVVPINEAIEQIIHQEIQQHFSRLTLKQMTEEQLATADYILSGAVHWEHTQTVDAPKNGRYIQLSASILATDSKKIIAEHKVWIHESQLDTTTLGQYQESPFYLEEHQLPPTEIPLSPALQALKQQYADLPTDTLLTEAETAYQKEDFEHALVLFQLATEREDGQTLRTYAGLYDTYFKLDNLQAAEQTFTQLLTASIREYQQLNLKLLFAVDSIEFINDSQLRQQYAIWLTQIGAFLSQHDYCFQIEGHSTPQEEPQLALARAQWVHQQLQAEFPDIVLKTQAVGQGAKDNIIGSGSHDLRDAIDRRVEFVMIDCDKL